jgi:hypothetical protein
MAAMEKVLWQMAACLLIGSRRVYERFWETCYANILGIYTENGGNICLRKVTFRTSNYTPKIYRIRSF